MEALWPETIVIVGLGDCVRGNTKHIDLLAQRLRERYGHPIVEACAMTPSRSQLSDVFAKCISGSARRILVVPYASNWIQTTFQFWPWLSMRCRGNSKA